MIGWQRTVRYVLAAFAILFAAGVYLAIREPGPQAPAADAGRTDLEAIAESVGGTAWLAKALRKDLEVSYGRMLVYGDGRLRFVDGLEVKLPDRSGRDFRLTARQGEGREDQTAMNVEGDVRLEASDGLVVNAERAAYDSAEDIVRVPDAVRFSRNRMRGSSRGATYDRTRDVLWMLADAAIDVEPAPDGTGQMALRAGAAGFARRDRYLRLEAHTTIDQGAQRAEADNAMAYLQPGQDLLTMVELRGNSQVRLEATGPGQLEAMSAQDINLHYREDGRTLERVTLASAASIQFAGEHGQAGRRLAASWMDITLEADGTPLIVAARDQVELSLPAEATTPARRIRAVSLEATGEPGRGLTNARFLDQVEFVEAKPARNGVQGGSRRVRSRSLDAAVKPGFASLDAANFGGGVRLSDGEIEAGAPDAAYDVAKGTMRLVAGPAGAGAQVTDSRATIEARVIDITLEGQSLVAETDVRSLLKASSRETAGAGGPRRPGMLKDDQPVNVTAAHLAYDSASGRATYTGDARLWQGETAVQGATIVLDDRKGNLTASGGVRSSWRLLDTDPKTQVSAMKTTVATGADLVYEDELRRATYTTDARMNGPEGDLRAQTIELYLAPDGDRLERLEAYTDVTLHTEHRESTGARLSYFAADDRYVMATAPGAPEVRILEQLPQECRETLGKTLTFHRATDTIAVDGSDERRTQTTSGGKCPEPRIR